MCSLHTACFLLTITKFAANLYTNIAGHQRPTEESSIMFRKEKFNEIITLALEAVKARKALQVRKLVAQEVLEAQNELDATKEKLEVLKVLEAREAIDALDPKKAREVLNALENREAGEIRKVQHDPAMAAVISKHTEYANEAYNKCINAFHDRLNILINPNATFNFFDPVKKEWIIKKASHLSIYKEAKKQFKSILEDEHDIRLISQLTTVLNNLFKTNFTYNPTAKTPETFNKLKNNFIAACDSYLLDFKFIKNEHSYVANNTKALLEAVDNVMNQKINDTELYKLSVLRKTFTCLKGSLLTEAKSKKLLEKINSFQKECAADFDFPECNAYTLKTFSIYISNFLASEHPATSATDVARQLEEIFVLFKSGKRDLFAEDNSDEANQVSTLMFAGSEIQPTRFKPF